MLAVAAIATIVCRRLKQPLVLGYVLAGFLVSPAISWFPDVSDTESISVWSEIGVIFLMFGLGLEFSITRLATAGRPAILTALIEMGLMMVAGFTCGTLLGWPLLTSLFLGGMIAISSTTIIAKTFDELHLKDKGFAGLVFGVLVIQDIAAVFLMVVLSTLAVGANIDGAAVSVKIGRMALYLIVWFVLTVIFVPVALQRIASFLTDEILLIASLALCLCMVALASAIGFSAALGAFLAGSILAGTVQAERIAKLVKPIKDLFGAVFFVSVGMLISPQAIADNAAIIAIVSLLVLVGMPLCVSLGALVSKQSLRTTVKCSMSMAQVGEFSFIIAALGSSLGVTEGFLHPVIVAVSVLTTLATPFYIKSSDAAYRTIVRMLPQTVLDSIDERAQAKAKESTPSSKLWMGHIKRWVVKVGLIALAAIASVEALNAIAGPLLARFAPDFVAGYAIAGISILVTSAFVSNLFHSVRSGRRNEFSVLWIKSRRNHLPLLALALLSTLVSVAAIVYIVHASKIGHTVWPYLFAVLTSVLLARSKAVHSFFLRIETRFIRNLNENIIAERRESLSDEEHVHWVEKHLYVTRIETTRMLRAKPRPLSPESMLKIVGQSALPGETEHSTGFLFGMAHGLDLIAIERDGRRIAGDTLARLSKPDLLRRIADAEDPLCVREGDVLTFVGTEDEVDSYLQHLLKDDVIDEDKALGESLEDYLSSSPSSPDITCFSFVVEAKSAFVGRTIANIDFKSAYGSLVVAIEHNLLLRMKPSRNTRLAAGDRIWLIGESGLASNLIDAADAEVIDQGTPEDSLREPASSSDGTSTGHFA
ncbi:cation:proton antiporter [Slackia sp.]